MLSLKYKTIQVGAYYLELSLQTFCAYTFYIMY